MEVVLSRSELASLIGKIQGIVPSKPAIPILASVLIEAEEGLLTISATDSTVSMRCEMEANVIEKGAVALPARHFFQLIRELTTPEMTLKATPDQIVYVQADGATFRLNGMSADAFPSLPDLAQEEHFVIPVDSLKEMLSRSLFAAAKEDNRHFLNGVLMRIENGLATFLGADGKKLARVNTPIDMNPVHKGHYLIPLKGVEEIIKSLGGEETVKVSLMADKVGIECHSTLLITKLLAGTYPDVERIIPQESSFCLTLHREELMALLKQVALFTPDKNHAAYFTFTPGELTLTANTSDVGDGRVSMPVDYSGEPLEIAFNPFFFHDILRHCSDETVDFAITTPYNPGLITDSTTAHFIIMPMRFAGT